MAGGRPLRVLLAQTSFLGDVVLTTPLAQAIEEGLPGARTWWLVRPDAVPLVVPLAGRDRVLGFDKRGVAAGLAGLVRTARRLRDCRFDAAIAVQRSLRTALVLSLAGIPLRIGFAGAPGAFLYHRRIAPAGAHARDRLLSLVEGLGIEPPSPPLPPRLVVDPAAESEIAGRLAAAGIRPEARLLVLAPGSAWATKRWPAARFGALAGRLRGDCDAVAIVGSAADAELSATVAGAIARDGEAGPASIDLCGRTDTAGLVATVARAHLVVANDSAAGHVAGALGRPVVSLFGPTVPAFGFAPIGPRVAVVEHDLECRPCARHGGDACPIRTHACMESIEVAEVAAAARDLLSVDGDLARGASHATAGGAGAERA
ncbi:MAG: lipopolysaccharide heptosyltransferase II [Alphaproteobacteria bacterium]